MGKTSKTKYAAPDKGKDSKDKCIAKAKHRAAQARYAASKKGKANKARYLASDNGKESQAKYAASKKGRAARARYNASDNRKVSQAKYEASEKGQAAKARKLARYALSREKRISQSIKNAKSYAYRSAINKGFSEQVAREKEESAATTKKAELSSTSFITAQLSD
ncbi:MULTISPECIES: hypothetical protein [unclassified Endozoicomonas]|uniref:hypothetical protein n=1 Tax=unclassified Endozoicomonas TaxID=2644528 RepID=UPI003BB5AC1F